MPFSTEAQGTDYSTYTSSKIRFTEDTEGISGEKKREKPTTEHFTEKKDLETGSIDQRHQSTRVLQ